MRRLGLWLVLCLLLVGAMPAWAAPRVEMTVQAANEGRVKQGGWVTVVVDLVSQGAEVSGELEVEVVGDLPHPQYVVPFTLPAGGSKRIPVSLEATGNLPVVVRLSAGGDVIDSKLVTLTWLPPHATMVGVLSGDELGMPALNQLQAFQGESAQVVRLTAATFPSRAALLEDFDVIALSQFDTAALSKEQLRALEVWVGRGGTLLLAGGPAWQRTLAPLPPPLVPVAVTGVREVDLSPLGSLAGKELGARGAVSDGRLTAGQGLIYADGVPLIVSAAAGSGRVLYLAFDPGLTPVVGWAGQAALYNRLLGNVLSGAAGPVWPEEQNWMLTEALNRLPDWGLPGVWTLALLLGGYLLLVGPANYLVLKRLDRREWGWLSVPGLSLFFLGMVYLVGFGRFESLVSHLITVTELVPGSGSATMNSHLGLYAPSRERLSVAVAGAQLVRPFIRGPMQDQRVNARIVTGERTNIELLGLTSYSMSGFSMEHDIAVQGGLELVETALMNGVLTGRLKNGLTQPVHGLFISAGNTFRAVGRLEPGQLSEPFALDVLAAAPFNPRGGPVRMAGALRVPEEEPGPDKPRRTMIRDYVLQRVAHRVSGAVLVSGWTEQPLASPNLPELGKLVAGGNMVYSLIPFPTDGETGEIPPGVILGRPSDYKAVDWMPHGYMLRPGSHSFTLLLPPLDPARVGAIEIDLRTPVQMSGVWVAVKNQQTGEWLPMGEQRLRLPGWEAFVSPAGLVELRYESAQHAEIQPPTLSVKGVGR